MRYFVFLFIMYIMQDNECRALKQEWTSSLLQDHFLFENRTHYHKDGLKVVLDCFGLVAHGQNPLMLYSGIASAFLKDMFAVAKAH